VCTFGSLASGATSSTMTINASVSPRTTGILHNDARVSSNTFDNNSSNDLASSNSTVNVVSSLSVTKVASAPTVTAGTPLSYQITIANGGPSTATSVTLSDPLPGAETFSSTGGVGTCGYQSNTNTVTCQLPNLDPGQNEVVFIYTTVKSSTPPGSLTNTATATATGSPNASGSVTTSVTTSADLGIVLSSDFDRYKPSTDIHYTVTVTNAGPSDAQAVVARVQLPPAKSGYYVSNNGGCTVSGTVVTCNLGTIFNGGVKTVQVNWHAQGNKGLITSVATVTAATADPNTANNSSTRNVTIK
jgi:uncharacterized repeat protein (TIGR01451 family)